MMRLLVSTILVFTLSRAGAQFPDYYVYLYKGDISVITSNKQVKVQPHQLIFNSDQLVLKDEKAELTLVNRDGSFIVVKGKGNHKVNALPLPEKPSNTITQKYLHLVWEELLDPTHTSPSKIESIAASWGGSVRGGCDRGLFPKSGYKSSRDTLYFSWRSHPGDSIYQFRIVDRNGKELLSQFTTNTGVRVKTSELKNNASPFFWSIQSSANPCSTITQYQFDLLDTNSEHRQIEELIKTVPKDDDLFIYNLEAADTLGRHGFTDEAILYLLHAEKLFNAVRNP